MSDHGYECNKCGYTPTEKELRSGVCPGCFRLGQSACQQNEPIGFEACWKTTPRGNCRLPKDHGGKCV